MGKRTHFGNLASLGLIVGALLGTRESLMTLGANAFVQLSQYFLEAHQPSGRGIPRGDVWVLK
jgi:hypothetical protein